MAKILAQTALKKDESSECCGMTNPCDNPKRYCESSNDYTDIDVRLRKIVEGELA